MLFYTENLCNWFLKPALIHRVTNLHSVNDVKIERKRKALHFIIFLPFRLDALH